MIRRESFGSRSEQKVVIDIIFVPFNLNILVHLLVVVHHGVHIEVIYLVVESAALQINSRAEVLGDLLRIYDVSRIRKIRLRLIFENTCLLPILTQENTFRINGINSCLFNAAFFLD